MIETLLRGSPLKANQMLAVVLAAMYLVGAAYALGQFPPLSHNPAYGSAGSGK
jgi:hypothetical protein